MAPSQDRPFFLSAASNGGSLQENRRALSGAAIRTESLDRHDPSPTTHDDLVFEGPIAANLDRQAVHEHTILGMRLPTHGDFCAELQIALCRREAKRILRGTPTRISSRFPTRKS